jgi:hypothetical protein
MSLALIAIGGNSGAEIETKPHSSGEGPAKAVLQGITRSSC